MARRIPRSVVLRLAGWVLIGLLAVRGSATFSPQLGWFLLAGGIVALGMASHDREMEELRAESDAMFQRQLGEDP